MAQPDKFLRCPISVGELVGTWFRVLLFVAGLAASYASLKLTLDEYGKTLHTVSVQTTAIEHYLSSRDPDYWEKVKKMEDAK